MFDGFLAGSPGYNLPKAAVANIFGAQQYKKIATDPNDLSTAFTVQERQTVVKAVLDKCDALDGTTDGMIQDTSGCLNIIAGACHTFNKVSSKPNKSNRVQISGRQLPPLFWVASSSVIPWVNSAYLPSTLLAISSLFHLADLAQQLVKLPSSRP